MLLMELLVVELLLDELALLLLLALEKLHVLEFLMTQLLILEILHVMFGHSHRYVAIQRGRCREPLLSGVSTHLLLLV